MRVFLMITGVISVVLGFAGVVLPLLPTTPFLLLAAFCFARSSTKFHHRLIHTKAYQAYVADFRLYHGYTMKRKVELLISVYIVVGLSIYLVDHCCIRIGLCIMLLLQTIVLLCFIKTLPASHDN